MTEIKVSEKPAYCMLPHDKGTLLWSVKQEGCGIIIVLDRMVGFHLLREKNCF